MVKINENYLKLPGSYLFSEVARRISAYTAAHPGTSITKLSIGDVTRPLVPAVVEAMHRAVDQMGLAPDLLLVDGNRDPGFSGIETVCVVGGDRQSASVAAASILAKVSRDRYMEKMEEAYPGYGFAKHKGYGTKEHRQAIVEKGPCPFHRESFLGKILSGGKK